MCGIFGFSGFHDPDCLRAMSRRLRHRGPDGEGVLETEHFSFGNRRLAIIDIEGGDQPIYDETGRLAVIQNGEIYNYIELRKELIARGHRFRTDSDTEVLVHGYEEWGRHIVDHLEGMFAIAIHDLDSGETFFARDHCGQKPFFYWSQGDKFVFASEIKALLECPLVKRAPDLEALDAYLCLRYVPEPRTMFAGISTLPAAHHLILKRSGEFVIERYWAPTIQQEPQHRSDGDYLDELDTVFQRAMELTVRSDVPVASYLSAGVDSSMIAKVAHDLNPDLHTFSFGFRSPIDETRAAAETARLIGSQHHDVHLAAEDFGNLAKVIYQMDVPVGDPIILAFDKLATTCAEGFKVVLSGEGADEIFAGYPFHKIMQLVDRYHRIVPGFLHSGIAMPLLRQTPIGILDRAFPFPAYLGRSGKLRLVEFLEQYRGRSLRENYFSLRTLWGEQDRRSLYSEAFRERATSDWISKTDSTSGGFLDRLLRLQFDEWLQDWAIIRQERNTMAHSLELRLPFLDKKLLEFAFRLPPRLKAKRLQDKIIERRLARRMLPREVVKRPKNPFFMPMEFFFENPEIQKLIDLTLNETQVRSRGYFDPETVSRLVQGMDRRDFMGLKQVMSLVILELWHMIYMDETILFD